MKLHLLLSLPAIAVVAACADTGSESSPGPGADGGVVDSGIGPTDGGPGDGGSPDGGPADSGTPASRVTYEFLGLEGVDIEEVHLIGDRLFAVTRSGLFYRPVAQGGVWTGPAFDYTDALVHLGGDELLMSAGFAAPTLQRSADLGESWTEVQGTFGDPDPERVRDFDRVGGAVFATGTGVMARSTDGGRTWTPLYGMFGVFATGLSEVHVDPRDGEIWVGGQGAIENLVFARSEDDGATWDEWPNLLGPPSTLTDIGLHPTALGVVFAGFEEGLMRTTNGGRQWDLVIDRRQDSKFIFGVEVDREVPATVYAGGWLKQFATPQPMILHISDDGGDTWTDFEGPADFGGIWDIIQIDRPATEPAELIMGLQNGGVYRVRIERPN